MRLRTLLLAICAMPVLLCTSASAKEDLVIGVQAFPSSLHPAIDAILIKGYVLGFALRPITAYDQDWKLICMLCAELPTIENGLARIEDLPNGGKGMAVTIKLKPELKWGDGQPVTAKDIEFTWRVGRDPNSGFSNGHPWDRADRVEVIDDHTAVMRLDKVLASYNEWDAVIPEHIEGPLHAKAGGPGEYINQTTYNRAPTTPGLYNGPYMITGYQSGAQIVLEPDPHWPGQKPAFKHIVIRTIENTAALQANLLSGDVDMVPGEGGGLGMTLDQVISLQKQQPDRFSYIFKPNLGYWHIDVQKENPILADLRVRQALLLALDRQTMGHKLFEDKQPVATSFVSPIDPNYTHDVPTYGYDPGKAKALLAEAGWKPGDGGICRNAAGEPLSIQLAGTAGFRLGELVESVVQNQWKAVCVDLTIKNEPSRTLFGETTKHRSYPGMVMYSWNSIPHLSPRRNLGSDQIPTAANNYGGGNWVAFSDPRMDEDIAKAESELDPEKRAEIWADMQRIYAEQLPALPLYYRVDDHVLPTWLKGFVATGHYVTSLWVEAWHPG